MSFYLDPARGNFPNMGDFYEKPTMGGMLAPDSVIVRPANIIRGSVYDTLSFTTSPITINSGGATPSNDAWHNVTPNLVVGGVYAFLMATITPTVSGTNTRTAVDPLNSVDAYAEIEMDTSGNKFSFHKATMVSAADTVTHALISASCQPNQTFPITASGTITRVRAVFNSSTTSGSGSYTAAACDVVIYLFKGTTGTTFSGS